MDKDKMSVRDLTMDYVKERAMSETNPAMLKDLVNHREDILKKCSYDKLLSHFKNDVEIFLDILTAYANEEYTAIPFDSVAIMAFALKYILEEEDLIHDSIPCHGQLDDAIIMLYAINITKNDVLKYKERRI